LTSQTCSINTFLPRDHYRTRVSINRVPHQPKSFGFCSDEVGCLERIVFEFLPAKQKTPEKSNLGSPLNLGRHHRLTKRSPGQETLSVSITRFLSATSGSSPLSGQGALAPPPEIPGAAFRRTPQVYAGVSRRIPCKSQSAGEFSTGFPARGSKQFACAVPASPTARRGRRDRMKFANADGLDRKSGGADARCLHPCLSAAS
jgi:hypothetical protein